MLGGGLFVPDTCCGHLGLKLWLENCVLPFTTRCILMDGQVCVGRHSNLLDVVRPVVCVRHPGFIRREFNPNTVSSNDGQRRVEGPKGGDPRSWGLEGGDTKISRLFPSPATNFVFCFSLWVSSWNCDRGSRTWSTQSARLGFSGVILCGERKDAKIWVVRRRGARRTVL